MSSQQPLVSVVTATYNRSQVLRLAIAALRRSTVTDWEQIIIGDACSDDTAEAVASFADQRLRFVNRQENCGEQSEPNNDGCRLANGRYIAFLNHDDLWLPDHLATLVATIEREKADLVYARGISVLPDGSTLLLGAERNGRYEPIADVQASLWLFRKELLTDVGPWRHSRNCRAIPSQDWLIRAWRLKKKIVPTDRVTVIAVHSAYYKDCYKERHSTMHEELFRSMVNEVDFRERLLTRAALDALGRIKSIQIGYHVKNLMRALAYRLLLALPIPPVLFKYALRSRRRGGYIRRLQRFRGSPLPDKSKKRSKP